MLNEIYTRSKIDPNSIFYMECHGTGTKVGDPIEANTVGKFFARSPNDPPLLIGSVKSVIGHTESTASIASIIKIALCMRYRWIPPNMNFSELNPNILANQYNLHVATHRTYLPPIDTNNPVMVGISGFGIGGSSSHCIVMEWISPNATWNLANHVENGFEEQEMTQATILAFSGEKASFFSLIIEFVITFLS